MTIKIEREALISVLNQEPSLTWPPSTCVDPSIPQKEDEFVLVNLPSKESCLPDLLRSTSYSDEDSLCTISTTSDSLSTTSVERRVSFAPTLVTKEWTRPYTPREEVSNLFYSTEDTNRFRQEYRLERRVLNELSIDPDTFPVDNQDLSNLVATNGQSPLGRHSISRVVVLHNNKLETFFNPNEVIQKEEPVGGGEDFFDNDSFWSGSLTWY